ncbi:MAG: hypothetical protein ACJZ4F_05160 [Candidatus Thalassarchaeaceae archaeon]
MTDINNNISPLIADFIIFQELLKEGNIDSAISISNDILERSRSMEERDHLYEARIRMERALIGATEDKEIGNELRWCVDRLNATSQHSSLHGIALLNLASWHLNKNEFMMALATHSEISPQSNFSDEIIALSRLESSRILASLGDYEPAMRHAWIARLGFSKSNMTPEFLVSSLEWLDMALDIVEKNTPDMNYHIKHAKPRETPGVSTIPSNPDDIKTVVEDIIDILFQNLSGEERNDIGLIVDASDILGISKWKKILIDRKDEIQDLNLLEALQS